ncbi:uncharacterized protein [Cicer arietinum]|uniref:Uncharacterized protein LOC101508815 n=1 Tax=Cicer arietinum TaxID=3827 RepID=A0A1S2YUD1_CICAR|nr:uncharacterized protein LOC101508815 [Cicer arietinum]
MKLETQAPIVSDHPPLKKKNGESFSFPSTPIQEDSDFEFGSLTPDSPSCTTSPADQLFSNGLLQPHSFPLNLNHVVTASSRTSSIGSKDSLLSSRSNSTNSSCSSARTSSSDSSERRLFHNKQMLSSKSQQSYGCSQRWHYITPAPMALNRDASKKTKQQGAKRKEKKKEKKKKRVLLRLRFVRRIFQWFFFACRQCHAMEPSKAHNKGIKIQQSS